MAIIRWTLITVLSLVWTLPASASPSAAEPTQSAPAAAESTSANVRTTAPSASEAASYAAREQQAQGLEKFQGGSVVIYVGSGVLLVAVLILVLLLI